MHISTIYMRMTLWSSLLIASSLSIVFEAQQVLQDAASSLADVQHELKIAEIIPTVIDDFAPSLLLNVTWPSDEPAELGNTINPKLLQKMPSLQLFDPLTSSSPVPASDMQYTVALTDPDAPSRDDPEWSEICHWIATNIHLTESESPILQKDLTEVMEWKPPGPPPKTGKHRYVFLAFAPANGTTDELNLSKPSDRQHWGTGEERHGVRQWADENGLVPVAANFIYSQNKKQ
ncbi:PEBP-like protein [Aulographum hederae CBS 113979]|uniref:PEBP-like protein n=1 Tax=Aulographum hederae CBS 113979 TaxID=1176131 RepID=A0A6G1GZP5_9PEZI|nr:PEBP-like protein [Aulographum hederae CBS 113979]